MFRLVALILLLAVPPAAAKDSEESLRAEILAAEEYDRKWRPQLVNWEKNKKFFLSSDPREKVRELQVADEQIETITAMLARNQAKREDLDARLAKVQAESKTDSGEEPSAEKPKGRPVEDPARPKGESSEPRPSAGGAGGGSAESSGGGSGGGASGGSGSGGKGAAPKSALAGANISGMLSGAAKGAATLKAGLREVEQMPPQKGGPQGQFPAGKGGPAGGGTQPGSFDPSRPASQAELAAAAHSGYGESYARLGLRASGGGIVESDGRPASAQRLAELRADIATQPRAQMYHPSYFQQLPRAHYEDLRRAAKDRDPKNEKDLKDVGLSTDERDFEYTRSCDKVQGDCNAHAKEGYDKGDFVPPSTLDDIWAAISEQEAAADEAASALSGSRMDNAGVLKRFSSAAAGWLGFSGEASEDSVPSPSLSVAGGTGDGGAASKAGPSAATSSKGRLSSGAPAAPSAPRTLKRRARVAFHWALLLGLVALGLYVKRRLSAVQD